MEFIKKLAFILVVFGAINWGLVIFDFNLVTVLFGGMETLVTIIYALIGLSGVYVLFTHWGKK